MQSLVDTPISVITQDAPAMTPATTRAFAHLEVYRDAAPVLSAWAELEASAPCSIYQTRAFLLPWIDTLGRAAGLAPLFVLARGPDARPAVLLCLGVRRHGPLRVAHWLGGRDSNFNMPLATRSGAWSRPEVERLLRGVHDALTGEAPDLYALKNQPFAWHGVANPMALLPHQASPSAAYASALPRDAEAFLAARLSRESRRRLRQKATRLAAIGPLKQVRASDPAARAAVIDAFLRMRNARFRAQGIASPFEEPAMRDFIVAASAAEPPGVELHALEVGGRIVAVWGGAAHQGQWSGMITAFDMDETIAPLSPGEVLLTRILGDACASGLPRFDLGIGAARYKTTLCDEETALFDSFVPMTPAGRLLALALAASQAVKRVVKANPRLLDGARRSALSFSRLREKVSPRSGRG